MLRYSSEDINVFFSLAEQKISKLGEELYHQIKYDRVDECLVDKINLLSYIVDSCLETNVQSELDVLVYFAMDYYNLYELAYSPFVVLPSIILSSSSSGSGVSSWNDLEDKPSTFTPSQHTHEDEEILVDISGITEFRDRFDSNFTGNLEEFIKKLMIKYQPPSFNSFNQNKGASFRLGQIINGTITFSWGITNDSSVKDSSNSGSLTISEPSPFTANLPFNLFLNKTGRDYLFTTDYTKLIPGSLTFTINGIASNDASMNVLSTSLTWYSEIWYGNSTLTTIDETVVETFSSSLTNSRLISFTINGSGYKYIFIPDNINQVGIKFLDPNSGFEIAMIEPTVLTVNNAKGVALVGKLYRTKNSLGGSLTFNIK
jgi:hypothetical protein